MIDPNKTYRTRDGRAVRIYATDGGGKYPVHGAIWDGGCWHPNWWTDTGHKSTFSSYDLDLIEVTLADELRDKIPWSALRPEIHWVAWDPTPRSWRAFTVEPRVNAHNGLGFWCLPPYGGIVYDLSAVTMPIIDPVRWRETLVERPDDILTDNRFDWVP